MSIKIERGRCLQVIYIFFVKCVRSQAFKLMRIAAISRELINFDFLENIRENAMSEKVKSHIII